ncbi:hypothetical protein SDC9_110718 [bioreactor metagenome]|uniref:Uncharacterized protein n=1 Tax=bioreactor metagenome TaxID=1076179 RepID=A0A645BPW0_9ZZZZ
MFNDMLGSTLGVNKETGFNPVKMTAFGETSDKEAFFTGKPAVGELGYAFLFRNYRADKGKWQTTAPLGYLDGWNNLAYVNNEVINTADIFGLCRTEQYWDVNGYLHTRVVHDVKQHVSQTFEVRGELLFTLGITCGTGSRSETLTGGNSIFTFSPEAFGFSLGSYSWNTSYSAKTVTLSFSCTLPSGAEHTEFGQKIVDYYLFSSIHVVAEIYECGEIKILSTTPGKTAYIDGVTRKNTQCKE